MSNRLCFHPPAPPPQPYLRRAVSLSRTLQIPSCLGPNTPLESKFVLIPRALIGLWILRVCCISILAVIRVCGAKMWKMWFILKARQHEPTQHGKMFILCFECTRRLIQSLELCHCSLSGFSLAGKAKAKWYLSVYRLDKKIKNNNNNSGKWWCNDMSKLWRAVGMFHARPSCFTAAACLILSGLQMPSVHKSVCSNVR